jgi:hypothetical protein
MRPIILRRGAALTAFVFSANLLLVPVVRAEQAELRQAKQLMSFMNETGALSGGWVDQRKAMETLRQRVKDSRLDLDSNGISFYRKKAKTMVDLERQRLRRGVRFLLENQHGDRFAAELRRTGHKELTEVANGMALQAQAMSQDPMVRAQVASEVADNYMSFRFQGYEQVLGSMQKDEIRQVMVDTETVATKYIKSGGDLKTLNAGIFAGEADPDDGRSKLIRWLVGAIAGVGLVIAVFFSLTTMTITPFLTFMATVVGLVALLGRNSAFQSIFFGNPYGPGQHPGGWNPYQPWNPYWPPQPPPGS